MKDSLRKLMMLLGLSLLLGASTAFAGSNITSRIVYLLGADGSWDKTDSHLMVPVSPNEYKITLRVKGNQDVFMKILDNDTWRGVSTGNKWLHDGQCSLNTVNGTNDNVGIYLQNESYVTFHYFLEYSGKPTLFMDEAIPVSDYNNGRWRIWGNFGSGNDSWQEVTLTKSTLNSSVYTGTLKVSKKSAEFGVQFVDNYNNEKLWLKSNATLTPSNTTLAFSKGADNNAKFELETGKNYTVVWDEMSKRLSLLPETVYLYGNVDNLYWDEDIYYELLPVSGKTGVYVADVVEISGQWDDGAIAQKPNERKKYDSTGDENYVGFFVNKTNNFDIPKYASSANYAGDNILINQEPKQTEPMIFYKDYRGNNFCVKEGFYKVTFDLINMTSTWEKLSVEDVVFTWFLGGDLNSSADAKKLLDQDNHSYTFGEEGQNVLQVGIEKNPTHRVARQCDYVIYYKEPETNTSVKSVAKRKVDSNIPNGFDRVATVSTSTNPVENADVTVLGDNGYYTNHLLQLNKAGTYHITASLDKEGKTGLQLYNLAEDNTMVVTVAQATASTIENEVSMPFQNKKGNISINFALNNSNVEASDINVTFAPANNAEGWATDVTAQNIGGENLLKEYGEIQSSYQGVDYIVDAAYNPAYSATVNVTGENGNYVASITAPPCSGHYVMKITPANSNYSFDETYDVYIYPNPVNQYYQKVSGDAGTAYKLTGFNVNGIPATNLSSRTGTVEYPYIDDKLFMEGSLEYSHVYFVGMYLASVKVYAEGVPNPNNVAAATETVLNSNYFSYNPTQRIDLSVLKNGSISNFYVYASKNGAETPVLSNGNSEYSFTIAPDSDADVPTGIEAIGSEAEGEAVFYNLQGQKVANPDRGVFVKVVNGKASKVIL